MKNIRTIGRITALLLLFAATVATAQVRPDQFPKENTIRDKNLGGYSQEGGVTRGYKMDSVLSQSFGIYAPVVTYVAPTGNPVVMRSKIVTDYRGRVFAVDFHGVSKILIDTLAYATVAALTAESQARSQGQSTLNAVKATKTALADSTAAAKTYAEQKATAAKEKAIEVAGEYTLSSVATETVRATAAETRLRDSLNTKTQPDWNATSGFSEILNKPQISNQWSFLGNDLEGNAGAFLGTTDAATPMTLKANNYTVLQLSAVDGNQKISFGGTALDSICNGSLSIGLNINSWGTTIGLNNNSYMGYNDETDSRNIVIGDNNRARVLTTILGSENQTSGVRSVSIGRNNQSRGDNSTTLGSNLIAKAYGSVVVGNYNDTLDAGTPYSIEDGLGFNVNNRVFVVGDGGTYDQRHNAITVTYGGNTLIGKKTTAINGDYYVPSEKLEVSGNAYLNQVGNGLIQKSPNGNCWKLVVSNTGVVTAQSVTCPN